MSDHLPECFVVVMAEHDWHLCICPALRACERRLRKEERALICVEQTALSELNAEYRKGVQAARDAVAALDRCPECSVDAALAAIDALRGES